MQNLDHRLSDVPEDPTDAYYCKEITMRKIRCMVPLAIGLLWLMPSRSLAEDKERAQGRQIPSVVAKVNGKEITADQYRNQWHVPHRMHMRAGGPHMIGPEYEDSMKQEVLERLIVLERLRQKADQMNIQPDPEDVEQRLQEIRGSAGLAGAMATVPWVAKSRTRIPIGPI